MFRVEFAPDAVYQLECLMNEQLEENGRAGAYDLLEKLETCIAVLREDPASAGTHMNGIPRKYRVQTVFPEIRLIYQIDDKMTCVRVDGIIEDRTEISN